LCGLPLVEDPNVIVGLEAADDAGVYRLGQNLAIIQTVDFFTPIVDDPYMFGQIATSNALSDVYAMGGRPLTAMNVVCFPIKVMDISVLRKILEGGIDKMREAGVVLIGGHSVEDPELKYGLSVTGIIDPSKLVTKSGAKPGDRLVLTKPLGTGIINTALKGGMAGKEATRLVSESMAALNKEASEAMLEFGVRGCTDITGFGFLGHACEMVQQSHVGIRIEAASVPVFTEAVGFAQMGMIPGGTYRNKEFRMGMVDFSKKLPDYIPDILFDPQTSGGLLIAIGASQADQLLATLHKRGMVEAAIVGEVVAEPKGRIAVE